MIWGSNCSSSQQSPRGAITTLLPTTHNGTLFGGTQLTTPSLPRLLLTREAWAWEKSRKEQEEEGLLGSVPYLATFPS
jgi:hypothetical protein